MIGVEGEKKLHSLLVAYENVVHAAQQVCKWRRSFPELHQLEAALLKLEQTKKTCGIPE
jgi:hypothetical protein